MKFLVNFVIQSKATVNSNTASHLVLGFEHLFQPEVARIAIDQRTVGTRVPAAVSIADNQMTYERSNWGVFGHSAFVRIRRQKSVNGDDGGVVINVLETEEQSNERLYDDMKRNETDLDNQQAAQPR